MTPEGHTWPLEPSTLLPHALSCARFRNHPPRPLETLGGIVGFTFGYTLLTLVMMGLMGLRNIGMLGLIVVAAACCVAACVSIHQINETQRTHADGELDGIMDSWIVEINDIEQRLQKSKGRTPNEEA